VDRDESSYEKLTNRGVVSPLREVTKKEIQKHGTKDGDSTLRTMVVFFKVWRHGMITQHA
jgi:hypothetical protein